MDSLISFFRDTMDGPIYYIIAFLGIIFIMAIMGFMMERKQKELEEKSKTVSISNTDVQINHDNSSNVVSPLNNDSLITESLKPGNAVTAEVSNFIDFGSTENVVPQVPAFTAQVDQVVALQPVNLQANVPDQSSQIITPQVPYNNNLQQTPTIPVIEVPIPQINK